MAKGQQNIDENPWRNGSYSVGRVQVHTILFIYSLAEVQEHMGEKNKQIWS